MEKSSILELARQVWHDARYHSVHVQSEENLPPSCRFPPLREGNHAHLVPPACRGNLKEGVAENAGVGGFARTKDKQPADNPALLRACKEFESLFVLQLWRAMQRTVPNQSKTLNYTEMFDLQFADYLSRQGRFGLAEQLYEQLSRHLPNTGGDR